jgi:hypothetical protein
VLVEIPQITDVLTPIHLAWELAGCVLTPGIESILPLCLQIILLTDGSIYGEQELFGIISKGRGTCQVYAFGIGFGASTSLIRGVARAGCGKAVFLREDNKTLKDKVRDSVRTSCENNHDQGCSLRTVRLPGTTESSCQAS